MAKTPAKKAKPTKATTAPAVTKAAKKPAPALGGYVVLARGKPLALSLGESYPKGGILERCERGTLFNRLNAAQAAVKRTAKYREANPKAVNTDTCEVIRLDKLEP